MSETKRGLRAWVIAQLFATGLAIVVYWYSGNLFAAAAVAVLGLLWLPAASRSPTGVREIVLVCVTAILMMAVGILYVKLTECRMLGSVGGVASDIDR